MEQRAEPLRRQQRPAWCSDLNDLLTRGVGDFLYPERELVVNPIRDHVIFNRFHSGHAITLDCQEARRADYP